MINIYDSTGNVILSPLTGSDAERVEELMSQDYAQLAWQSDSGTTLPAGSYIMLGGEKLTLLDPYEPEQKDEAEWSYRPKFQSHVMGWGKVPFFHYTYGADNAITAREPDWTLTDTPSNFMASVCKAIKNETGETWTYEIAGDIIATTITLSFSSADILSGLGQIAGGYDTEWRADKSTNTLYLGKAQHGTAVTLQVDSNVGVPSVTRNKVGYYNRFYIFGSTRNITQDYQGANVNGLVNKRLTLDPAVYPGGYIDIPRASGTPVFPKILTFDDIYPHSGLTVADLRPRLMYRLDTDGNKVQVGTDSSGNAVYDMYTIWYFQLPGFTLNDSTYSKDNPTGMLISGKALSVHFKSGALTGREFELIYHPKAENLHNSDGQDFYVKAGDYEIKFIEENGLIIPMQTGIVPATGDEVILFNIRMPQEYVATAYTELKEAALKEISDRYTSDLNNYTIKSNPVAFADSDPGLSIGQKVLYVNGDYSYETRVIKLVRKLDIPSEQEITIGSEKVKGNSETLKEEVVNANSNIDILTQLNQLTQNVVQAYQRTQQLMLDGLGKLGRMWEFDPDDPNVIYTKYNFYGKGWGSVLGKNPGAGTIAAGATTLGGLNNVTELADSATAADKVLIRRAGEAQWTLANLSDIVGLDTTALATYLSNNHYAKTSDIPSLAEYATRTWVQQQGYLTEHQSLAAYLTKTEASQLYQPIGDYATNSALNSAVSSLNTAIGQKLDKATFDDLFAKESDGNGGYRIRAKYAIYSNQYISCLGNNPGAGTTTGGGVDLDAVRDYLTEQGYATQQWVQAQGYLKAADLSAYALADNAYLKNQQNRKSNAHTVASLTAVANSSDSWVNNYSLSLVNNNNVLNFYVGGVVNERQALIQSGHSSNGYAQVLGVLHLNKLGGAVYINNSLALTAANVGDYAVTLDTEQEIPGKKTFTAAETAVNRRLYVNGAFDAFDNHPHYMWHVAGTRWTKAVMDANGHIHFVDGSASGFASYKSIKALAFVVAGGTSSQILRADGSVGDELAYLRYRGSTTTDADNTLWSQIGLKSYHNALPDGLSGVYNYGEAISFAGDSTRFDMYVNHHSSDGTQNGKGIYYRSGWNTDKRPWQLLLDTNNYASVLDARYVHGNYIQCGYGAPTLQWVWGSDLTHVVGFESANNGAMRVYSGEAIRAFANAVNKAGDTMTGLLKIKTDTQPCLMLDSNTANKEVFMYIYSGGVAKNALGWNTTHGAYIYNSPSAKYLGIKDNGTPHFQGNTLWHAGNDGSGSGLDADLIDGHHATSLYRVLGANLDIGSFADSNSYSGFIYINDSVSGWSSSIHPFSYGGIFNMSNGASNVQIGFRSDFSEPYIRQRWWSGGGGKWSDWKRLAFTTSNVASATKLQTARSLWGNSFDGTGDISGNINLTGQHAKIGCNISDQSNECPWYGLRLSIMEGWHVMLSGYYGTSLRSAGGMLSLAQSGNVGIGTTTPAYKLHVVGDIMAEGWVRTTGAHGWYNQTYGGGWYMDNATWIKAYNKPVYIAYTTPEGPASFGVGLRCYHASHTSVEVQGGSYTMGLGCNSNGSWYWWRGTSSGKGYVMQYNGTLWSFTGEIKSSVGMHSDGYMSCLGKNTGSDARLKDILGDVTLPIDVILGAPAVRFRWNANAGAVMAGKAAVGTIAQYWLEHLTEVVGTMPTGYYGVNYGALDWIAIHSVAKYAKTEIELLKEENRRLKERVAALERRLAA